MSEEDKPAPVEVTLPDDPITQVELSDNAAKVTEEAPAVSEKKKSEPDSEPQRGESVDEREVALKNLKAQYEYQKQLAAAEREARLRAEQYAQQQLQQVHSAQNEVQDSNLRVITNAIASTEQQAAVAEQSLADALAAGDYAAAAKAQRALAQAEAHLLQLENGKARLEESLNQTQEGRVEAPQIPNFAPQVPKDPVEIYAERLTPKSASWLRSHPEVVDRIPRLTRAHEDALEDGLVAESPEYFSFIEQRLGIAQEAPKAEVRAPTPKKSVMSAPVSGTTAISATPRQSNSMVLSSDEVEMAILASPDLSRDKAIEEYARNKAYLIKSGKLSA
jgi:hypothetical protein